MVNSCLLVFVYISIVCIRRLDALENGITREVTQNLIPCKEGWHLFGDKCYKVQGESEKAKWHRASEKCSEEGGKLATIYSKEMRDFFFTFLLLNAASDVWIGLNDLQEEGKYVWDDGSVFNYSDWEPDEPSVNRLSWEDCVLVRYWTDNPEIGKWIEYDCRNYIPYVCQEPKDEKYQNPDPRFCSAEKGGGWKYLNSCYQIVTEKKTWNDAEKYCQQNFNGHLATVIDFRAEYFLNNILSKYNQSFWYGIKIKEEARQQWASGWQVIFNRWEENAPFVEGTCALRTSGRIWKRECCAQKHSFVCETSTDKPPVEENGHCPETSNGWKNTNGKLCYFVETKTERNWNDANYDCMSKGGTLVNIHSLEDLNHIYVHIRPGMRLNLIYFYIGLHRKSSNKEEFVWTDGRDLTYRNWLPAEPNDIREECVTLHGNVMRWNDRHCDAKHLYICSTLKVSPPEPEEKLCTCKIRENIADIVESVIKKYVLPSKHCAQD